MANQIEIEKMAKELAEEWCKENGKSLLNSFNHYNSGDGFIESHKFENWVKEKYPDKHKEINKFDNENEEEFGSTFVYILQMGDEI